MGLAANRTPGRSLSALLNIEHKEETEFRHAEDPGRTTTDNLPLLHCLPLDLMTDQSAEHLPGPLLNKGR